MFGETAPCAGNVVRCLRVRGRRGRTTIAGWMNRLPALLMRDGNSTPCVVLATLATLKLLPRRFPVLTPVLAARSRWPSHKQLGHLGRVGHLERRQCGDLY